MRAAIIDIDGTLTKVSNPNADIRPINWKQLYASIPTAEPNKKVVELTNSYYDDNVEIIFLTGRPTKYRKQTLKWLYKVLSFTDFKLFMRSDTDFRDAPTFKKEVYDTKIKDRYDVTICLDDDPRVIAMWKAEGLKTKLV